jgi:tRNA (guanine-N7-)-methyltransferase
MGRRALRKIDPNLDLSYHYKELDDLPRPWDASALFGREAPLEIEIGSGKGLFMRTAAEDHPERDFLGIEIARKYARFAAAGLAKRGLMNGVMVGGDGAVLLHELIPDASIHAFHVYFPDPWWKKRHRFRRIMREDIVLTMQKKLIPGGELHFWTDVQEYFDVTMELLAEKTDFVGPIEVEQRNAEHDLDYQTHFERRMRMHEESVYRSLFRKAKVSP